MVQGQTAALPDFFLSQVFLVEGESFFSSNRLLDTLLARASREEMRDTHRDVGGVCPSHDKSPACGGTRPASSSPGGRQ